MCTSTNGLFIMLQHYFRFSISWMYLYTVGLLTPARFPAPRRLCVPAPTCEILLFLIGGAAGKSEGNCCFLIHLLYPLPCCQVELLPAPAALYVRTRQAYHSRWSLLPCRPTHFWRASHRYRAILRLALLLPEQHFSEKNGFSCVWYFFSPAFLI